jgi:hypothetical protein
MLVVAAVALGFGALVAGAPWLLVPAACAVAFALVAEAVARRRSPDSAQDPDLAEAVNTTDACLRELATLIPEDAMPSLTQLKRQLADALAALRNGGDMPPEERFFVSQTVRRYVPDICARYSAAAEASSGMDFEAARAAATLSLRRQLDTLALGLRRIVVAAVGRRTQSLLRNEAFLRSKREVSQAGDGDTDRAP